MAARNSIEKFREFFGNLLSVKVIEHLEDEKTFEVDVNGSQKITGAAGLIGEDLNEDVVEIEIIPLSGAIAYNPGGTAVAGVNGRILQGVPYLLTGDTVKLNQAEIVKFIGAAVAVTVITRKLVTG